MVTRFLNNSWKQIKEYSAEVSSRNREIIANLSTKPKLYRLPTFWVWYRFFYPYLFFTLFIILMIVALSGWNIVEGHLVLGSTLSLVGSLSVIASYYMNIPWRKHPSSLMLYRTLTTVVFSVNIIFNAISVASGTLAQNCRNYAVVTLLMLLAGEGWLTAIAADLVSSVTNPFTSYKANVQRYQVIVWSCTGLICFVFYFNQTCQGSFNNAICWVSASSVASPCLWGYYLIWMLLMYCYQVWATIFAYLRLKKGLPATFEIRKKCAMETFQILASYAGYVSLVIFFVAIFSSNTSAPEGSSMNDFGKFVLFVIASRGTVDGAVWFHIHSFENKIAPHKPTKVPTKEIEDSENTQYNPILSADPSMRTDSGIDMDTTDGDIETADPSSPREVDASVSPHAHGAGPKIKENFQKIQKNFAKTITEIADVAIEEIDEADLSPQVNLALRQQIVQYVTTGVKESVKRMSGSPDNVFNRSRGSTLNALAHKVKVSDPAMVEGLTAIEFQLDGELPFKSFAPDLFRELRQNEGIDDDYYLELLNSPANERLSEGASGAFMFFCGHGEFIVKTIRAREARVLHQSMKAYTEYLRRNKESLLCRFLGSYSLAVYSQVFYFVIMRNCFDPAADINERYDIKGSWVGRSADPGKTKKRATCRHCNTYFVPSKREQCTVIVGRHEANVVFKDNDMRAKISLAPDQARRMVNVLMRDSDLLGKLGVIDYSLLVGVKKWKFPVAVSDEEVHIQNSYSFIFSNTKLSFLCINNFFFLLLAVDCTYSKGEARVH